MSSLRRKGARDIFNAQLKMGAVNFEGSSPIRFAKTFDMVFRKPSIKFSERSGLLESISKFVDFVQKLPGL